MSGAPGGNASGGTDATEASGAVDEHGAGTSGGPF